MAFSSEGSFPCQTCATQDIVFECHIQ
jgi:hypothetical protein